MKLIKNFAIFVGLIAILACLAPIAHCHRLNVFAWQEGNKIIVDSNFGENRPAKNADVKIMQPETRRIILTGKTDENGKFSFPAPEINTLDITVSAGQGHQNTWRFEASGVPLNPAADAASAAQADKADNSAVANITAQELRAIIREELQTISTLQAINQMPKPRSEPGYIEIIGGIGWIVGLGGIFLWFRNYRRTLR